jgi:hypothetical protein
MRLVSARQTPRRSSVDPMVLRSGSAQQHMYRIFSLTFRSDCRLFCDSWSGRPGSIDVSIERSTRSSIETVEGLVDSGALFRIPNVGLFRVQAGNSIRYWCPELTRSSPIPNSVKMVLSGPCMAAILRQRGMLALHASSVLIGDKAVCFLGSSQTGKSSLAASFLYEGYRVLSDDLVAIQTNGVPRNYPGFPRIFLRKDAAKFFSESNGFAVKPSIERDGKLQLQHTGRHVDQSAISMSHVYQLKLGPYTSIEGCGERQAYGILRSNLRGDFAVKSKEARVATELSISSLARNVRVATLQRAPGLSSLRDTVHAVVSDVLS